MKEFFLPKRLPADRLIPVDFFSFDISFLFPRLSFSPRASSSLHALSSPSSLLDDLATDLFLSALQPRGIGSPFLLFPFSLFFPSLFPFFRFSFFPSLPFLFLPSELRVVVVVLEEPKRPSLNRCEQYLRASVSKYTTRSCPSFFSIAFWV